MRLWSRGNRADKMQAQTTRTGCNRGNGDPTWSNLLNIHFSCFFKSVPWLSMVELNKIHGEWVDFGATRPAEPPRKRPSASRSRWWEQIYMDIMDSDHLRFRFSTSNDHSSHDQKKFSWFLELGSNWWTGNYQATGSSGSSFHPAWNDWWAGNQAWAHDLGIWSMTCSPKNEKDNHNWKRVLTVLSPHFHLSRELCHKLGFGNYIPSIATLQIDAAEKRAAKAEQEYKAMETMETTKTAQSFHHVLPCFQRCK